MALTKSAREPKYKKPLRKRGHARRLATREAKTFEAINGVVARRLLSGRYQRDGGAPGHVRGRVSGTMRASWAFPGVEDVETPGPPRWKQGAFSWREDYGTLTPPVRAGVELVTGLFNETLGPFLEANAGDVLLVNIDNDGTRAPSTRRVEARACTYEYVTAPSSSARACTSHAGSSSSSGAGAETT